MATLLFQRAQWLFLAGATLVGLCLPRLAPAEDIHLGLPILTVPVDNPPNSAKVALGKKLFFDPLLSSDDSISCASCHVPGKAFADGKPLAEGIGKRLGTRNVPSLLNVAFNSSEFWDGRRSTLETQALDPLVNPREHGLPDYATLLGRLRHDGAYIRAFHEAFGEDAATIRIEHVGRALASFERTLIAGDSPFDRYAFGHERNALTPDAQRGLVLFQGGARCAGCHAIGPHSALFTDNDFHSLSIGMQRIAPRLADLTTQLVTARRAGKSLDDTILSQEDLAELGRFAVTMNPADIGKFRTPSLRNVALTSPYMHNGSVPTLEAAVEMELYNRGTDAGRPLILTPREKTDLVAFLKALTSPFATRLAMSAAANPGCGQRTKMVTAHRFSAGCQ